jgi:hypothetical protein
MRALQRIGSLLLVLTIVSAPAAAGAPGSAWGTYSAALGPRHQQGTSAAQTTPGPAYVGSALWSKAFDVRFEGNYIYAAFLNGLAVFETDGLRTPVPVSRLYLGGGASLEVRDKLAYIAAGARGLAVVDVADPKDPALRGSCPVEGEAKDVALAGTLACVAAGEAGLLVFDVGDPAAPRLVGAWDSPGGGLGVVVRGDLAYLADGESGIAVVSIKDPAHPKPLGALDTDGTAEQIALSRHYAFVADGAAGMQVVDMSNPAAPKKAASFGTSGYCHSVDCEGTRLAVGNLYDGAAQLVDVSDPLRPDLLTTQKYTMYNEAWRVKLRGDVLTIVDYFSGIHRMNAADPKKLRIAPPFTTPSSVTAVATDGRTAFAVGEITGLNAVNIADPTRPAVAGATGMFRGVNGLALAGTKAYMTDRWSVKVFDVADPARPRPLRTLNISEGVPRAIVVQDRYAYLTADKFGLYVLDVSDPSGPVVAGTLKMPGFSYGLAVEGGTAYVANSDTGFHVVDIRDPASPRPLGALRVGGEPYGVAVRDGRAYVAAGAAGFLVLDVTKPEAPRLLGRIKTGDFAYAVALRGQYALVADGAAGIRMIDISDPAKPRTAAVFDTPGDAQGLVLAGSSIVVADSYSLLILR